MKKDKMIERAQGGPVVERGKATRWRDLPVKEMVSYGLAIGALTSGYLLLFLGMYLPPAGEIHHSVLTAFGITGLFTGSLLGITMHYTAELANIKEQLRIKN